MSPNIQPMTFSEWLEANPDLKPDKEKCEVCNGNGYHSCSCGDEHDCGYCNGTGEYETLSLKDMYTMQLAKDKELLRNSSLIR